MDSAWLPAVVVCLFAAEILENTERSGFNDANPGRGTYGTAGELANEADMSALSVWRKYASMFRISNEKFVVLRQ